MGPWWNRLFWTKYVQEEHKEELKHALERGTIKTKKSEVWILVILAIENLSFLQDSSNNWIFEKGFGA